MHHPYSNAAAVGNLIPLYRVVENVATDLESFSQHAGRTTVTTDDVLLLARRNQDLYSVIKDVVDKEKAAKAKGKGKSRG